MKFIFTSKKIDLSLSQDFPNLTFQKIGKFSLLINDLSTVTENENFSVITNGYLRDFSIADLKIQKSSAAEHIFQNWPVADHITGSFCALVLNKISSEIVITSDLCNVYPLYYLIEENEFYISNSIILLGRHSKATIDKTGIFQRAIGPNFNNIGSRTILQNCKRLLPGEWIKINAEGKIDSRRYDNSLYSELGDIGSKPEEIKRYWEQYKTEVSLCTQDFEEINIALSGGIDSRIALGAIPKTAKISAKTYGNSENYESKIAARLAKIKGAEHKCYFDPKQYFPDKTTLENYCLQTEAVKLNSWLEILENANPEKKNPILLGELCEGLPARNIKKFNSTEFRNQNFFKYYINDTEFQFTPGSNQKFENWKESKLKYLISWHDANWFKKLGFVNDKDEILKSSIQDSYEIFDRIADHNLPYVELYDELFSWYTFTRMELSRQVNICNEDFYAFSPGMSIQMLRMTSNIHPNERLYYRFANKLFGQIPDLKKFNKIPTSQIPMVPQNWPNFFKIPIWGIRSKIDDLLVQRLMKSKDKSKRYRLLKSNNWVDIYQQEDMLKNIRSYYNTSHLTRAYIDTFYQLAEKRQNLSAWPFANMDIISGACLNTEIDLIKKISS